MDKTRFKTRETCPVCLDDFLKKEKIAVCSCHHVFHSRCLLEWLQRKNNCPLCKATVRKETSPSGVGVIPVETTGLILSVSGNRQPDN
ncbi:RING finger protein 24 [Mactra antiquata]